MMSADVGKLRELAEEIKARSLIGIPGGFTKGVTKCLPTDGDQWGYVLSQSEFDGLLSVLDALEAANRRAELVEARRLEQERNTVRMKERAEAAEASRDQAIQERDEARKVLDWIADPRCVGNYSIEEVVEIHRTWASNALAGVPGGSPEELSVPCQEPERSGLVDGGGSPEEHPKEHNPNAKVVVREENYTPVGGLVGEQSDE